MQKALRSSLPFLAVAAALLVAGCATHDRHMYTTHRDKNLHTPDPWAPSASKAADDATASMGLSPQPATATDSQNPPGEQLPSVSH